MACDLCQGVVDRSYSCYECVYCDRLLCNTCAEIVACDVGYDEPSVGVWQWLEDDVSCPDHPFVVHCEECQPSGWRSVRCATCGVWGCDRCTVRCDVDGAFHHRRCLPMDSLEVCRFHLAHRLGLLRYVLAFYLPPTWPLELLALVEAYC